MPLLMFGINHMDQSIDMQEACRLSPKRVRTLLTNLPVLCGIDPAFSLQTTATARVEAVILSTCSRLELYTVGEAAAADSLFQAMLEQLQFHKIGVGVPQFNAYRDRDAIKHLLRIAGDLEPLYIGEPYGLKKLTEALGIAQDGSAAGPILSHLFDHAIHTGRRIQAETQIGGRTKYLSRAALGVIGQRHWEMIQGNLLIVGASDVAHLAAQALAEHTAQPTATINRTAAQTETMRRQVSGQTFSWHQMRSALAWADVVVTAGSALYPIVDTEDLAAVLPLRRGRALLLIDLGQPRNVHPAIKGMDTIIYYNLRDLQSLLTELARRAVRDDPGEPWVGSLPKIEQMVQEETQFVWDSLKHASGRILPA